MALAIVQHQSGIHPNQVPGQITLASPPTVDNVIIVALGVNIDRTSLVINAAWTQFELSGDPTELGTEPEYMIGLYHYVQPGDTATLPAFASAGSTFWTHAVYEVSGVSGVWNNDLLFSAPLQGWVSTMRIQDMNGPLPGLPAVANGSLALSFVAAYNGNTNPTISGAWTLDESANNPSNYGNLGAASRLMNAGDTIDGGWTIPSQSGQPAGGFTMMLTTAQPTTPYPKHAYNFMALAAGFPTTSVLPWQPQAGNLWLMFLAWGSDSTTVSPTLDTNFTSFDILTNPNSSANMLIGLQRVVQGGDTSALPNIATAGDELWSATLVEVSGVPANFAATFGGAVHGSQINPNPMTTTAQTTTKNNQLGITEWTEPSDVFGLLEYPGGGWKKLIQQNFFGGGGGYGTNFLIVKFFPDAGSTVQSTFTPIGNLGLQGYMQLLLGPAAVPGNPAFSYAEIFG